MKLFAFLTMVAACCSAHADCSTPAGLTGMVTINQCAPADAGCVRADKALYENMAAMPDDGATTTRLSLRG